MADLWARVRACVSVVIERRFEKVRNSNRLENGTLIENLKKDMDLRIGRRFENLKKYIDLR